MSVDCAHGSFSPPGVPCHDCWDERIEALLTRIAEATELAIMSTASRIDRAVAEELERRERERSLHQMADLGLITRARSYGLEEEPVEHVKSSATAEDLARYQALVDREPVVCRWVTTGIHAKGCPWEGQAVRYPYGKWYDEMVEKHRQQGTDICQDPICPREHDALARHVERRKAVRVPLADPIDVFRKAVPATDQGAFDARAETGNQPNGTPRYDYALVGTVSAKKDGRRPSIDIDPGCYVIDGENLYVRRGHK